MSVTASAKGFEKSLRDETDGASKRAGDAAGEQFGGAFGGSFKKLAAVAGSAFAGLEIGRFLKGSIEAASSLSETVSKSNAIFGESAGEIEAWASTAAKSLGQSKEQALGAAAQFGNMFDQLGIGSKDAAKMSKQMVELATDFASFHNADISEVLEAQTAAFRGEYDSVQKFVPTINAANVEQKALALGLKGSTKELTAQDKAIATQALLMEGAGKAVGDFAKTSGGLANQQRILSAQFDNLKATIGGAFIPLLVNSGHILTNTIMPALQRFADLAGPTVTKALQDFKGELDGIGVTPAGFFARLGDAVGIFIRLIKTDVPIAIQEFKNGFKGVDDALTDSGFGQLAFDIGQVVETIFHYAKDAPGAVQAFVKAFQDGGKDITSVGLAGELENIGLKLRDVVDFVKANQDFILPIVAGLTTFATTLLTIQQASKGLSAVQGLSSLGSSLAPLLLAAGPIGLAVAAVAAVGVAAFVAYKKFQPFRDIVDSTGRVIRDVAVASFEALVTAAVAVGNFVGSAFESVRGAVDAVMGAFEAFGQLMGRLFQIVVVALTPLAQWINDNLVSTINAGFELIGAVIQRVFGIVSNSVSLILAVLQPVFALLKTEFEIFATVASTVVQVLATVIADTVAFWVAAFRTFIDVVAPIWETFFQNILTVASTVIQIILTVIESVLGVIRGVFQVFTGLISGDWSKLWEGVQTIVSSLFGAVTGIVNAIWSGILGIFANSISGLQATVTNGFNSIVAFVGGIPGRIASSIGSLSGILFSAGQDLIRGLLNGINSMVDAAASAARRVAQAAANAVKSVFGIGSPSKLFMGYGVNVVEGFVIGIDKSSDMAAGAVNNLLGVGPQSFAVAGTASMSSVQAPPAGGFGGAPLTININAPLGVDRAEVVASVQQGLRKYEAARSGTRGAF